MRCKFWCILMFILAVIWALLFVEKHCIRLQGTKGCSSYYGGGFDIRKFLAGLRKKYTMQQNNIEIELKLKNKGVYERLAAYVRTQPTYTEENTINRIWRDKDGTNIIETTLSKNKDIIKWSTKKRLSKYDMDLGTIAVSLERELDNRPANIVGEPMLIRRKNRISTALNENWRIDCTQVEQNNADDTVAMQNEVEIEYIAPDYWNSIDHINEITEFLANN